MTDVLAGDACPVACALTCHAHRNLVATQRVVVGRSVGNGLAVEGRTSAVGLECIESIAEIHLVAVGIDMDAGFYAPAQTQVGVEDSTCSRTCQHGIDLSHRTGVGHIAYSSAIAGLLEHGVERCHIKRGVAGGCLSQTVERRSHLVGGESLVELEVGRTLQQVTHTRVVFHTGKLEQNLTVLALEHLDVGRNHAELVDTVAEHVGCGIVHTVLHLALECGAHGIVGSS